MKSEIDKLDETYNLCLVNGKFREKNKIEAENHQCKNAYICFKHKELEFNWEFLETIRLKRNAINYRGYLLKYEDWNSLKLGFELHIKTLIDEINERLK